ncbi:MAG: M1 family metallopeptidase, partial [Myxococcota bacterium]
MLRQLLCGCMAVVCGLGYGASSIEAQPLPETSLLYRIEVELVPETRQLDGWEHITWTNTSAQEVSSLPLHLHLNAFSNLDTTWMREGALNRFPVERLLDAHPDLWGWTELTSVEQQHGSTHHALDVVPIQPDDGNPNDRSMVEVKLAEPIQPGGVLTLRIAFEARLPIPIARTGGRGDFFLVAQWFPKISVLETQGTRHAPSDRWGGHQFHGPTEFYADFADFDVTLTAPQGWLIAATGRCNDQQHATDRQQVRCTQRAVHDFAFVAGDGLEEHVETYRPQGGGPDVRIRTVFPQDNRGMVPRWRKALHGAMDVLGQRVGPYPYRDLTVVMPPSWAARTSGMEYPTFLTGFAADPLWSSALVDDVRLHEMVLIHEFGHQYFYGLLATHEQEEALLDEGFNSYWEYVVLASLYGEEQSVGAWLGRPLRWTSMRQWRSGFAHRDPREPLRKRPSWLFYPGSWASQIYSRPALLLLTAERLFGAEPLHRVFASYYRRWAFKHPDLDHFLEVVAQDGPPGMEAVLREGFERSGQVDYRVEQASSRRWKPPLGRVVTED